MDKEQARAAYKAGFMGSGEGWNGEYPYESRTAFAAEGSKEQADKDLDDQFEEWYKQQGRKL